MNVDELLVSKTTSDLETSPSRLNYAYMGHALRTKLMSSEYLAP
jgi:hypothetical protein